MHPPLLAPISHIVCPQKDIRAHLNGILWLARSGARWSDLPAGFGPHQTVYSCFLPLAGRWNPKKIFERCATPSTGSELSMDSTSIKASVQAGRGIRKRAKKPDIKQHRQNARRVEHENPCHRRKRPAACGFLLSAGNVDDCTEAVPLLKLLSDLKDCDILADKAYGTKEIRTYLHDQSARYTIPPKVNTKQPWPFDKETYKRRNVIERFFNRLKEFRRAETRYDKRMTPSLLFVMVAAICVAFRHFAQLSAENTTAIRTRLGLDTVVFFLFSLNFQRFHALPI